MRACKQWLALAPLFFIAGCSTLQQSPRLASSESALCLSEADQNLGEALAHYSQGLIDEATLGTSQSAFLHFKEAARLDPSQISISLKVASDYVSRKDYAGAIAVLVPLQRSHPDSVEIRLLLGAIYQTQGNQAEAVRCFMEATRMAPERPDGYIRLATLRAMEFDSRKTMAVIKDGLRQVKNPLPLIEFCESVGSLFISSKDIPGAILFLKEVLAYKPGNDTARELLARCYVATGQERNAIAEFGVLQKKNPDNPQVAFWIGELYEMLGQKGKALEAYELASKQDPNTLPVILRKANLEMELDPGRALKTLAEAIQRSPDDFRVRVHLALLYMELDRYGEGLKLFDEVAGRMDLDESVAKQIQPLFYFWYGSACERVGRVEEAERYLSRYLAVNPDSAETLNYLAYIWAEQGIQLEQAEAFIAKALSQDPDNGAYLDTRGWIQYKRGDYANALKNLRVALRKTGDDPAVLDHLGDVCAALNKPRQAIDWWLKSLKMTPANRAVREKLIKAGVDARDLKQ